MARRGDRIEFMAVGIFTAFWVIVIVGAAWFFLDTPEIEQVEVQVSAIVIVADEGGLTVNSLPTSEVGLKRRLADRPDAPLNVTIEPGVRPEVVAELMRVVAGRYPLPEAAPDPVPEAVEPPADEAPAPEAEPADGGAGESEDTEKTPETSTDGGQAPDADTQP